MIKISERSIYTPIIQFLEKELNARGISEPRIGRGFVDIFFQLNSTPFIIEIKFGGEREYRQAIDQVFDYAIEYNTKNIIVLVLPKERKGQVILDISKFYDAILSQRVRIAWIHTDYWSDWPIGVEIKEILKELERRFRTKKRKVDFNSIVKAIRENVQDLYTIIRQAKTEEIFEEVTTKLELFTGLSEIKRDKELKARISMLASYLLFNQLLFYHVYQTKSKDKTLPELRPIKSIRELNKYFSLILNIDYQPIYEVKLINKIPERRETVELINRVIKNLILLRAEHITQDLAGKFFHALLPKEVAKVWAAFYTNPIAAEILANLVIEKWDETILDPACGSGTLLAACYRRKLRLFEKQTGKSLEEETIRKLHKKFVEEHITGIDIMPFAAHLTTINLASQKLDQPTNIVRIARMDSLELAAKSLDREFKKKGILLRPFVSDAQLTLTGRKIVLRKATTVSPSGIGKEFYLKPVDIIIMNPPFSDKRKLPTEYNQKLKRLSPIYEKVVGGAPNLWAYFIRLADLLLKDGGKIALVIPINLFRGFLTKTVREFLIQNYRILYIIKPEKEAAFSESAQYRDVLLIAKKGKPKKNDITKIVFVNTTIRDKDELWARKLSENILNSEKDYSDEEIQIVSVKASELMNNINNLMPFLIFSKKELKPLFKFLNELKVKMKSISTTLKEFKLILGFNTFPAGTAQKAFITRPTTSDRIKQAFLVYEKEQGNHIIAKVKDSNISVRIAKTKVYPALRTNTGISTISIDSKHDFLIGEKPREYKKIEPLIIAKIEEKRKKYSGKAYKMIGYEEIKRRIISSQTFLALCIKFNIYSPNSHLFAFVASKRFSPLYTFLSFPSLTLENAKILALFFNSIAYITQFLSLKSESQLQRTEIKVYDLSRILVPDINKLQKNQKIKLLKVFERLKNIEFPSLIDQFKNRFWGRMELDETVLGVLGFSKNEIKELLPQIYDAIVEELETMKKVK